MGARPGFEIQFVHSGYGSCWSTDCCSKDWSVSSWYNSLLAAAHSVDIGCSAIGSHSASGTCVIFSLQACSLIESKMAVDPVWQILWRLLWLVSTCRTEAILFCIPREQEYLGLRVCGQTVLGVLRERLRTLNIPILYQSLRSWVGREQNGVSGVRHHIMKSGWPRLSQQSRLQCV